MKVQITKTTSSEYILKINDKEIGVYVTPFIAALKATTFIENEREVSL